jgi:UDP-perosamine 4-acetyltransferase
MNNPGVNLPVIVLGAGGHAKVLIDLMLNQSIKMFGITDCNFTEGAAVLGIPVIGADEAVWQYSQAEIQLVNGIGSVADLSKRILIFERFKKAGYPFATLIHPAATVSPAVEMDEGVQIMAGAIIQAGSNLGSNCIINTKVSVDHDCSIGNHVHLAPGVTISGGVTIHEGTHIGTGATVIQNIRIGKNSIIGAGAVVIKDVPDNAVVVGVPGKVIKYR